MTRDFGHRQVSSGGAYTSSKRIALRTLCLLVVLSMSLPSYLPFLPNLVVRAQNDPPPFGEGDWVINTPTLIWNQSLRIHGRVLINSGGSLTLDHSLLILMSPMPYQYNFTAYNGSAVNIINGSYLGSGDTSTAFQIAPLSRLIVRNSTISNFGGIVTSCPGVVFDNSTIVGNGDSDGIGLGVMGGSATIRHTNISGATRGIWMDMGTLDITDSTFLDNPTGLYMMYNYPCVNGGVGHYYWPKWSPDWVVHPTPLPCGNSRFITVDRTSFLRDAGSAVWVEYSNLFMNNSQVLFSSADGVYGFTFFNIDIENTEISHIEGIGIELVKGGPEVTLKNVNVTDCRDYSYRADDGTGINSNWSTDSNMRIDSNILGTVTIHADHGGHLTMENTNVSAPTTNKTSIVAGNGGTVDIINSTLGKAGQSVEVGAADGGTLRIHNSIVSGAGQVLESSGNLTFDNSSLMDSPNGITVDGGRTVISNSTIHNCSYGLQAKGGTVKIFDSNITASSNKDINMGDGQLQVYDTNFTSVRPGTTTGKMQVFWSSRVRSMWTNGATIANATINVTEDDGTLVWTGTSGSDGLTPRTYLRQYFLDSTGTHETTPHHVHATYKGMSSNTPGLVEGQTILPVYLEDHILPKIKIITPPNGPFYQKNNTLFVNGTAWDNESGIDRVQWSLDEDLWTDVNGLGKWNFTTNLKFGSYEIYFRALDRAGNAANVTLNVTIDNTPPYLYILSPNNNFTTKLMTVLVEGATEAGATVTIKGQSMVSVDGTFRMSVPIDEGVNVILVTVKDPTGNTNSTSVRVIRRSTPPKIIITYPPDNLFTNRPDQLNMPVTGFTDPGVKLMSQDRLITVNDDGSFSFTYGLKEGMNEIYLLAEDSLGNQNTSLRHVTYDITKPSLNITSPDNGYFTNQTSVTITGTTKIMATVTALSLNFSAKTQADPDGRFEMKIGLSEAQNIFQLTARDRANNTNTPVSLTVYRDTVAPTIKLNGVKDGMVSDQAYIIVEGQTEVGAHVKLNGEIISVGVTGSFSATLNLTSANNTFVFDVVDRAGNTNALTVHVKRKVQEPTPQGTAAALDYMPWLALLAVIILVVQWVFLTRYNHLKAKKSGLDKDTSGTKKVARDETEKEQPQPPQRMMPKRPRKEAPIVVEQGAPEFEIEYGNSNQMRPGGGHR